MLVALCSIALGAPLASPVSAGPPPKPITKTITICLDDPNPYTIQFVAAGFIGAGAAPLTTTDNSTNTKSRIEGTDKLVIVPQGLTKTDVTVDVSGDQPALNGNMKKAVLGRIVVRVIECRFTTGDWFHQKGRKDVRPGGLDDAHERNGDAPIVLKDLGDSNCYESARADAMSVIGNAVFHVRQGIVKSDVGDRFGTNFSAFQSGLETHMATADPADVMTAMQHLAKLRVGSRYVMSYTWSEGKASGTLDAIGGHIAGVPYVMSVIVGNRPCTAPQSYKNFVAITVASYAQQARLRNRWKTVVTVFVDQIRQRCCPLEKTPTGAVKPVETPSPTPKIREKPITDDPDFDSIVPPANLPTGFVPDERSYVPKTAGPGSTIVAKIEEPNTSGPSDAIVTLVTDDGKEHSFKTRTDEKHRLHFTLPIAIGTAAVTAFLLSKGFDRDGHPDEHAARSEVGVNARVPNTDLLPNVPNAGVAIVRGASAYETTPGRGILDLQTRGTNPLTARVAIDGNTDVVETQAASDTSIRAEVRPNAPHGRSAITVISDGRPSNPNQADIVSLTPHPLPVSRPGVVQTLVVDCDGLGNDPATMDFDVSGAATLADGSHQTSVPVTGGKAQVQIRGTAPGAANVRFKLHVVIPGFWEQTR